MAKKNIIAQPTGRGQYRKRAYCEKCGKRVGLYSKQCHHCGVDFDR